MVHTLSIPYDDALLMDVSLTSTEFEAEARFLLAAKLYELGRVTSGRAAALCEMTRVEFLLSLARVGVSMTNLRPEDADDDIAFAQRP
jgi:predicted HTH domain antitoxin